MSGELTVLKCHRRHLCEWALSLRYLFLRDWRRKGQQRLTNKVVDMKDRVWILEQDMSTRQLGLIKLRVHVAGI